MGKLTVDDLYEEAERFLWDKFGLSLTIPIEIDEDMSLEGGAFEHTSRKACAIYIADFVMKIAEDEVIYDILRHELIHFALFTMRKPFNDGDPFFEETLAKHGVGSSGTDMIGVYHIYVCHGCGEEVPWHTKFAEGEMEEYLTTCCSDKFKDTNRKAVFTGKERYY